MISRHFFNQKIKSKDRNEVVDEAEDVTVCSTFYVLILEMEFDFL